MVDTADRIVIDAQAQLRKLKSLAQLVLDRQTMWETDIQRSNFVRRAKNIITYCRDDLDINLDVQPGTGRAHAEQAGEVYTSRVATGIEDAADAFCGNLFVPTGWFGYNVMDPRIADYDDVQAWMQRAVDYFGGVIGQANFYPQMPNVAKDSLSIGEGLMFVGEDEAQDRPYCHYWEALNTWFIRDVWGSIIAVHHRWRLSALEAYGRWGTKCSRAVIQDAEGNRPAEHYSFIQSIYRRNDNVLKGRHFEFERKYIELWVQEESEKNDIGHLTGEWSDPQYNGIIEQGGYDSMPVLDWPYSWKSSETYGRGPLHLTSIKRLHAAWKGALLAIQRLSGGPMLASKDLEGILDLNADVVTWVADMDRADVRPIYPGGSIQPEKTLELIRMMEEEVRDMLKLNVFMAMTLKTKDMRVDEVMQVVGEQAAMLAPRLGLLSSLFLDKFHGRLWDIEVNRGRLERTRPPKIIGLYLRAMRYESARQGRKFRGLPVRVVYTGPLQVAMDSYFVQRRLTSGLAPILTYLHPLDPEAVGDKIDVATATEEVLDHSGFMQSAIRSDADFAARQRARADAAQALVESQAANQQAGAMKSAAEAGQIMTGAR